MSEDQESFKVVIEIHGNIAAANVYFNFDDNGFEGHVDVHVHANQIVFDITAVGPHDLFSDSEVERPFFHRLKLKAANPYLIPASFYNQTGQLSKFRKMDDLVEASYKTVEKWTTFRLQINLDDLLMEKENLECSSLANRQNQNLKINYPYIISCASCHHSFVENCITFVNISILPFDLTELYENLFCHKKSPERSRDIICQPVNELFSTSTCYVLSCLTKDCFCKDVMMGVLRCKNCSSIICNTKRKNIDRLKDSVFCFKDKISFIPSKELVPSSDVGDNAALRSLICIIQDTLETSVMCKLYLEAKVPVLEDNCLLIWVLDHSMKRFVTELKLSRSGTNVEEPIEMESVMKILYCVSNSTTDLARTWVHDFSVDFHHISDTMLLSIKNYLSKSAYNMPRVSGYPLEFSLGYLPLHF